MAAMDNEAPKAVEAEEKPTEKADFWSAVKLVKDGPLLGLFVVLGLEIYGAALTIPVFSFFCIYELGLDAQSVGILLSSYNLAQAIGSPVFGRVSDALGRRWILLLCFFWSSVCFMFTYLVQSFYELLIVRTIAGLSGGSIPISFAMIMDSAGVKERPQVLGIKGAFIGICFMLGPITAVVLLATETVTARRQIFVLSAIFCFAGFLLGLCIIGETLPPEKRRPLFGAKASDAPEGGVMAEKGDEWAIVSSGIVFAWITRFFYALACFSMYTTFSFLIKDNFGWSDKELGMLLSVAGIVEGLLGLLVYPRVDKAIGEHYVTMVGLSCVGIGLFIMPSKVMSSFFCGFVLFNVGQSMAEPGTVNLIGINCPSERYMGFAQGCGNGFRAAASVLGPFTAGTLYDIEPSYCYAFATASCFLGVLCVALSKAAGVSKLEEGEALVDGKKDP